MSRKLMVAAFVSTLAAATLLPALSEAAETIKLRMNHWSPAVTVGAKVDKWWADEVGRRTNGRVEVKIFWAESLGQDQRGC